METKEEKLKRNKRNIGLEMLDRKRRIQEYFISGDESKRPADVTFVTPFDVPTHKD